MGELFAYLGVSRRDFALKRSTEVVKAACRFLFTTLLRGQPLHLRLYGTGVNMGVIVQCHGDVGVAHDVLQRFGVHTGVCHAGTERVPEGVRGDVGQRLLVLLVAFGL